MTVLFGITQRMVANMLNPAVAMSLERKYEVAESVPRVTSYLEAVCFT